LCNITIFSHRHLPARKTGESPLSVLPIIARQDPILPGIGKCPLRAIDPLCMGGNGWRAGWKGWTTQQTDCLNKIYFKILLYIEEIQLKIECRNSANIDKY